MPASRARRAGKSVTAAGVAARDADSAIDAGPSAGRRRLLPAGDPRADERDQRSAGQSVGGDSAHELAHIRRHDYLVNLLQTLLETVFFYHPARVVAVAADSQRAGELLRRPGGRRGGQWRGLRSRAVGGGRVAPPVDGFGARCSRRVAAGPRAPDSRRGTVATRPWGRNARRNWVDRGRDARRAVRAWRRPAMPRRLQRRRWSRLLESQDPGEPPWGQVSNGLRTRVVAVAPETDEQKPDWAAANGRRP